MNLDEIRRRIECEQENMPKHSYCCGTRPPVAPLPPGTPSITIGTVTTSEPGSEADASITGTAPNYELNLTIPQGEVGPQGIQGEVGETGPQGEVGPAGADGETPTLAIGTVATGEPGTEAVATITGEAPNYVLNLTIPQGEQGEIGLQGPIGETGPQGEVGPQGPAGEDGLTPTLTIGTVTTGEPGTEASATITGTAPNFVLNLTIPQGEPGTPA